MSLLLRNACQETLDNAGLGNFHVRTNEHSNTMTIVGECGQPFVSISGIKFARTAPSNTEIPLAVELLEVFLAKHKPDFDMYTKELIKYKALPEIKAKTGQFEVLSEGYRDEQEWVCQVRSGCYKVKINADNGVKDVTLNGASPKFSMQEFSKGPNFDHLIAGREHLKAYIAYMDARKLVNELKSKLSSCEI